MSTILCNAPFCQNERNPNHAWCGVHRWERQKYKIKPYKELLPYWCLKRCDIHGYLKSHQVYVHPNKKQIICLCCRENNRPAYDPVKTKQYNEKYSERRKDRRLKKRYQISIEKYFLLLSEQASSCGICKIHISDYQKNKRGDEHFHVDHCHITKEVRGLLCFQCNIGLGYFQDNPELTQAATSYLTKNKTD